MNNVFFSVGIVDQDTIAATSGVASTEEMRRLRSAGVKAVLCGYFIDACSSHVGQYFATGTIGANLVQFYGLKTQICFVASIEKVAAVRAAIAGRNVIR